MGGGGPCTGRLTTRTGHNHSQCLSHCPQAHPSHQPRAFPHQDDAFATLMQWLYARLPHTRG